MRLSKWGIAFLWVGCAVYIYRTFRAGGKDDWNIEQRDVYANRKEVWYCFLRGPVYNQKLQTNCECI